MTYRSSLFAFLALAALSLNGCSTFSKMTACLNSGERIKGHNPEQMRISTDSVVFQPMVRVDVPQFSGLQTPLVGGNRTRSSQSQSIITLARFTPVTVLSNNGRNALVQIKGGQRGFVPSAAIASETEILATAQPATPAQPLYSNMPIDPATGLPYDPQALYLPRIDAGDAPVDEAMLNNIDSIPLPESEKHAPVDPEAQDVDGIVLRPSSDVPAEPTLPPVSE